MSSLDVGKHGKMLAGHDHDPPPVVMLQDGNDALRYLLRRGDGAREGRIGPLIRERVLRAFLRRGASLCFGSS